MAAVASMPIAEYDGWVEHFSRYPPGDPLSQRILAQIWADIRTLFSAGKRVYSPYDVAPWLETAKQQSEREEKVGARRAAIIAAAYDAQQEGGADAG